MLGALLPNGSPLIEVCSPLLRTPCPGWKVGNGWRGVGRACWKPLSVSHPLLSVTPCLALPSSLAISMPFLVPQGTASPPPRSFFILHRVMPWVCVPLPPSRAPSRPRHTCVLGPSSHISVSWSASCLTSFQWLPFLDAFPFLSHDPQPPLKELLVGGALLHFVSRTATLLHVVFWFGLGPGQFRSV